MSEDTSEAERQAQPKAAPQLPAFSEKKLKKLQEKYDKRGIVYISRIPPHLKPQKLRQMLEQYAEIGRVYLAPEDPLLRKKRKQQGGNSGKNFTEGWVEFEDKAQAKEVVAMLNGQQMGGKRRSAYFYDLWCMKYLPKFKWDYLTEEINYQKAVREQRLAAEISAAKRERDFYLSRVDKAKGLNAVLERKRKREEAGDADADAQQGGGSDKGAAQQAAGSAERQGPQQQQRAAQQGGSGAGTGKAKQKADAGTAGAGGDDGVRVLRTYGQRRAKADPVTDAAAPSLSPSLLKLIAGKKQQAGAAKHTD